MLGVQSESLQMIISGLLIFHFIHLLHYCARMQHNRHNAQTHYIPNACTQLLISVRSDFSYLLYAESHTSNRQTYDEYNRMNCRLSNDEL